MGNLINPVSERLGITTYWSHVWALNDTNNYSSLSVENLYQSKYIDLLWLSFKRKLTKKLHITFISYKSVYKNKNLTLLFWVKVNTSVKRWKNLLNLILPKAVLLNSTKKFKQKKLYKSKSLTPLKLDNMEKKIKFYLNKRKKKSLSFINNNTVVNYPLLNVLSSSTRRYNPNIISVLPQDIILNRIVTTKHQLMRITQQDLTSGKSKLQLFLYKLVKYLLVKIKFTYVKNFFVQALMKFIPNTTITALFILVESRALTAEFVAQFVIEHLKRKTPIKRLLKIVLGQLRRYQFDAKINGFKLVCSGRFERRGRASYEWDNLGKVPNTNLELKLDYCLKLVTLTNSLSAVKVWLAYPHQPKKILVI